MPLDYEVGVRDREPIALVHIGQRLEPVKLVLPQLATVELYAFPCSPDHVASAAPASNGRIVVAQHGGNPTLAEDPDRTRRIVAVADDVAGAHDLFRAATLSVREHPFERLRICVYIRYDCMLHRFMAFLWFAIGLPTFMFTCVVYSANI